MKAKSRLKPTEPTTTSAPAAIPSIYSSTSTKSSSRSESDDYHRSSKSTAHSTGHSLTARYLKHLPLLFLGLVMLFGCSVFFQTVSPSSTQNILFPNSYIFAVVLVFVTLFLLSSFVLLNTRRGLLVAAFITVLFFLRLQRFEITAALVLILVSVFVIIDLSGSALEKVLSHNAGIKPRTTTRKRSQTP